MKNRILRVLLIALLIAYLAYRIIRLTTWVTPMLVEIGVLVVAFMCFLAK